MLPLVESFVSIQGESTQAGRKCFFLRLAGCNLACRYCDTRYAMSGGIGKSVGELADAAASSGVKLVEITGGEPLIHAETPELARELQRRGLEVMIETNGSLPIDTLPAGVRRIVDCKLPDSGMSERNLFDNYRVLTALDEVKFVISSRRDFEFALDVIARFGLEDKTPNLLASPVWGAVAPAELAQWVIDAASPLRFQLQLHKVLWGEKRGV